VRRWYRRCLGGRYKKEGIAATDIEFSDNDKEVATLVGAPIGIFTIVDEQARLQRATDMALLEQLHKQIGKMAG
jgi:myosin heavy subunit